MQLLGRLLWFCGWSQISHFQVSKSLQSVFSKRLTKLRKAFQGFFKTSLNEAGVMASDEDAGHGDLSGAAAFWDHDGLVICTRHRPHRVYEVLPTVLQ